MQILIFLFIIFALSIECRFQEPVIATTAEKKEQIYTPVPINTNAYTLHKINAIIQDISNNKSMSETEKISLISGKFLGTPYQSNTLHGSEKSLEIISLNFKGLDCVTYIDYVTALSLSHSQSDFFRNIIKIRYINNNISYYNRRHFFTDWAEREDKIADDITVRLNAKTSEQMKSLNQKNETETYLPGIPIIQRNLSYIPSTEINDALINQLKPGDLIGIYSPLLGLDVSHVGIVIFTEQGPVFRHASSSKDNRCVVDSPLMSYLLKHKGIIVFRIKSSNL